MTTVRCYLPLSAESLVRLRDERRLTGPLRATAVTEQARAAEPTADEDELEYAACQAAAASLAGSGAPVVVAAAVGHPPRPPAARRSTASRTRRSASGPANVG